ncbi:MAG: hypothetical protein GX850_04640 [Clostridiaceae bacterium]|nr:hypothetical protein [Clostridiaceae bacterium]
MNDFLPRQAHVDARAKINLSLEILSRRPDGYHELMSVMATLRLADRLFLSLRSNNQSKLNSDRAGLAPGNGSNDEFGWLVNTNDPDIPDGQSNLCYRVAQLFCTETGIDPSSVKFEAKIDKKIPSAAGLGGGSADAAAVLRFLWDCWQNGLAEKSGKERNSLSLNDLERIALVGGADIPFCLSGGVRVCRGMGEKMTHNLKAPVIPLLLVVPNVSVQTVDAFRWFDESYSERADECAREPLFSSTDDQWEDVLFDFNGTEFQHYAKNDFLPVVARHRPEILSTITALRATSAVAVSMTGSGPTCFGVFGSEDELDRAYRSLSVEMPDFLLIKTELSPETEIFSH